MVSIVCNTYNQEKYIREAIDSFLMQQTDFEYEILIHDDASTDRTPDIIKEYEKRYHGKVRPIYQKENQYSQGIPITTTFQVPRARGKYIALCEGDDYWTDSSKLQKQVNALEKNHDVDMCAHAAIKVNSVTGNTVQDISPYSNITIASVEDVIMGEGGFFATNSLMYRKEIDKIIPPFREDYRFDYALQIQGALRGGIVYLPEKMSAYRWMSPGSWTSHQTSDCALRQRNLERKNNMLAILDNDTSYKYHECIENRIALNSFIFYFQEKQYKIAFSHKCNMAHKYLGFGGFTKYLIKAIFPSLDGITNPRRNN